MEHLSALGSIFIAMNSIGINVTVSPDDYDVATGEVTVDLSVGQYLIEMSPDDPRDANASDYYSGSDLLPNLNLGLCIR